MKITNNMVKALIFTIDSSMAISMMFLTVLFEYNSLQRPETRNALDFVWLLIVVAYS